VPTGKSLGLPLVHDADILNVNFTADDSLLVVRSGDGVVRIWNVPTGRLAVEPIRVGDISWVDVNPNGRELLTVSADGTGRRWKFTPSAITPMEMITDLSRLAIHPDVTGAPTAWAVYPDHMQKIDLLSGRSLGEPKRFPVTIKSSHLSPDEKLLAVRTTEDGLELWNVAAPEMSRKKLGQVSTGNLLTRFSPDSSYLAGSVGQSLSIWDTRTGEVVFQPKERLAVMANRTPNPFSPGGRYFAAYSQTDNAIRLIDVAARKIAVELKLVGSGWAIQFTADERLAAVASGATVQIYETATGNPVSDTLPHRNVSRGAGFTRDGRQLLTWGRLETYIWDVPTGRLLVGPLLGGNDIHPVIFSPDERRIATFAATRSEVRIFDRASGALIAGPLLGATPTAFSEFNHFTADGKFLIARKPGAKTALSVWPVPPSSDAPAPPWLLRLATLVAGGEIDHRGLLQEQTFDADAFDAIRAELAALPKDAPYAEWGRWILADRATRLIGPGFTVTAAEMEKRQREAAAQTAPTAAPKR